MTAPVQEMKNILIVDDIPENLYLLRALLIGNGYGVTEAANGAEALEKARSGRPDLIISDILMPVMDGFALCREWKRDDRLKEIPFVFFTATYTDPKDEEFALGLGAERFIVKPQEPEILMRMIEGVFSERKADRLAAPCEPHHDETVYFRKYNEALIRKLEDKVVQNEEDRRRLEREVAERIRTEEALRLANERFRRLVDSNIVGIVMANAAGDVIDANDYYLRMIGYTREELALGKVDWRSITPPEWIPADEKAIRELRECGTCTPYEKEYIRRDGVRASVLLADAMLPGPGEEIVAVAIDITERKRAEKALADSTDQLRQSQKIEAVGRLAGGVAHDFNNLLTVITGYCELMMIKIGEGAPLFHDLQEIRKSADRAAALTRQLLAFSRRQILQPKVLEIDTVVPEMDKMLRRLIGEDIDLVTILGAGAGKVKFDPSQIEQAIVNLVINSRDAMPAGGTITIETTNVDLDEAYVRLHGGVWPGPHVMLAVSDTGCGMDPETLSKAFDPFFTTKEKGKGTGLGLSTVFGIVKQSGGCIDACSEPGRGTVMKIYLPRVTGKTSPKDERRDAGFDDRLNGSETILLVEDDETLRKLALSILEGYGYTVLSAGNGEEALQRLNDPPGILHLLLTDVVMPKLSGRELSDRIKEIHPDARVLFMSGYTDDAIVHHGVLDRGVSFLQKPFTPKALARKVREVLDRK